MLSRLFCCCQSPSYIFGLKKPAAKAGSGSAAREIRRTLLHPLSDRGSFAEWSWLHWARSCMGQALKGPKLQAHAFALRAQGGVVTSCQDLAVISHHQNKPSQLSQTYLFQHARLVRKMSNPQVEVWQRACTVPLRGRQSENTAAVQKCKVRGHKVSKQMPPTAQSSAEGGA